LSKKKEDGIKRSQYYWSRLDHYEKLGYCMNDMVRLAHADLAKEFKQKNPLLEKPKPI
jgi:hypothetical protein